MPIQKRIIWNSKLKKNEENSIKNRISQRRIIQIFSRWICECAHRSLPYLYSTAIN